MEKQKKQPVLLNLILITLFIVLITYLTVKYTGRVTELIKEPDKFRNLLNSYGSISILVFIFFQIIQVVIAAIPGEFVQIAGGYVYGTVLGTVYSTIGILLGSIIVFCISRFLGFAVVKRFIPEKSIEKFNFLINSPKSEIAMFLLFLIPGIPKDIVVYIAGLTPIKPVRFFIVFTIARFPALMGSSYIGANLQERNYLPVIIVSAIACILFAAGVLAKDKVISKLNHLLYKNVP